MPKSRYDKLKEIAERMTVDDMVMKLHELGRDDRFAALIKLLEIESRKISRATCKPTAVNQHGDLAHAAGGVYLAEMLLPKRLQAAVNARVSQRKVKKDD